MAKDPAMLWYWSDWHSGTSLLTRFLKGCYMDLLHAQFNNGRLSLEEIKTCLGSDFGQVWPALQKKFKQDDNGLFFNERLELEKEKRKAFTESRRQARLGKTKSHDTTCEKRMIHHTDNTNENEDVIRERGSGKGWNTKPGQESHGLEIGDIQVGAVIELFRILKNQSVSRNQVVSLWKIFKIQNLTGKNYYKDESEPYSHFVNWCKKIDVKDIPKDETVSNGSARLKQDDQLLNSVLNGPGAKK
jgi:hypothetical protein